MNCCAGEDDAGGFILIETNLPNANAADSSIAGCILSLTHNICLVFCVSTQCSRGKASSPTDGVEHKNHGCLLWNLQCLNHAKTLESRGERLGCVMWCWARTWRHNKSWCVRSERGPIIGLPVEEDGEASRQRGDRARLFSPTVMWPTGAGPPLLCVGFGGREGGRGEGGWGQYKHLSLSKATYMSLCILEIIWYLFTS